MPQRLGQHLISRGLLPQAKADEALAYLAAHPGIEIDTALLALGLISEVGVLQAMSDLTGIRPVNLFDFEPNKTAAPELPVKIAERLNVVPLSLDANTLHVAVGYPIPHAQLREIAFLLGKPLEPWISIEARRREWMSSIYGLKLVEPFISILAANDPTQPPSAKSVSPAAAAPPAPAPVPAPPPSPKVALTAPPAAAHPVASPAVPAAMAPPVAAPPPPARSAEPPPPPPTPPTPPLGLPVIRNPQPPPQSAKGSPNETYSDEVRHRREKGIVEEPVLLVAKKKAPAPAPADPFASPRFTPATALSPGPQHETRVMEVSMFPGGILPPPSAPRARSSAPAPVPSQPTTRAEPSAGPAASTSAPGSTSGAVRLGRIALTQQPAPGQAHPLSEALPAKVVDPPNRTQHLSTPNATLAQAREALKAASKDREALFDVVLSFGQRAFDFVAAFAVVKGSAHGWSSRGDQALQSIRQVAIPLDAASVFRTVSLTRGSYLGPLPKDALSKHYISALHRTPRTLFLWPIEVKSRLVAMIYADCSKRPVSQRKVSDLILLCQELPAAFSELLLHRRQIGAATTTPTPVVTSAPPAIPQTGAARLEKLMSLLVGPDITERGKALTELMRTPTESALALARAFPGPTGWSRMPVVERPDADDLGPVPGAMAQLGSSGAQALAPLLDAADSDTRYLALLTAGSLPFVDLIPGILRGIFDLEPDISSAARAAATAFKQEPFFQASMPQLRQELQSRDPLRRSLAARALGVLFDRAAIPTLIAMTSGNDALSAQSAAEALREITHLNYGLQTSQWAQWWETAQKRRRVEWLVDRLESNDMDARISSIEVLTRFLGDNLGYRPDGDDSSRSGAIHRWREYLLEQPHLEL